MTSPNLILTYEEIYFSHVYFGNSTGNDSTATVGIVVGVIAGLLVLLVVAAIIVSKRYPNSRAAALVHRVNPFGSRGYSNMSNGGDYTAAA